MSQAYPWGERGSSCCRRPGAGSRPQSGRPDRRKPAGCLCRSAFAGRPPQTDPSSSPLLNRLICNFAIMENFVLHHKAIEVSRISDNNSHDLIWNMKMKK